jgi:Amino acid permease
MVVGSVIGAGIFLVPHRIATLVGCSSAMLSVWAVAGAISLFGVLAIAELAGRHPQAGGLYVFLRESYGRPVAFLYGWTFTPHKETLDSPFLKKNVRELIPGLHKVHPRIYALQSGYRRCGQSGIEVSDWWPPSMTLLSSAPCGQLITIMGPSSSSIPVAIFLKETISRRSALGFTMV